MTQEKEKSDFLSDLKSSDDFKKDPELHKIVDRLKTLVGQMHHSESDLIALLQKEAEDSKTPESRRSKNDDEIGVLIRLALMEKSIQMLEIWINKHDDKCRSTPSIPPKNDLPAQIAIAETTGKWQAATAKETGRWQMITISITSLFTLIAAVFTLIFNFFHNK